MHRLSRVLAAAFALLQAGSLTAVAEEVALRTQTALPKHHDLSKSFLANFVAKLNAAGKGVVRIDYLGGPEVNPANKAAPALKRGVLDILHSPAAYHAGIIPHGLTMMATNLTPAQIRANGGFDMLAPQWEEKLNARILAWAESGAQFHLYMVKEPPMKDGKIDLAGVKMRTTGAYRPLLNALGATPVRISAGEVYTGLQRGVVEGFGWPTVGLNALGLAKLVKYRIDPPFYHLANLVLINIDKWKTLPKPAQDLLMKIGAEYERTSIGYIKAAGKADAEAVARQGVRVFKMSAEAQRAYLKTAYDAMWKRIGEKLSDAEVAALRAKMYKE
jgi:TRAP-type C4-dicarboxylate transport system substrate-binding protein